jgi:cytochrome oxidase assembly protein ShyY1
MSSAKLLLRPKWIVRHVLVLVLVIAMPLLGLWQLQRLHDRRQQNHDIESRADQPAVAFPTLVTPDLPASAAGLLQWRRVSISGTYRSGADVLIANRTVNARPGDWLVSLLDSDDGRTVAVVRGFVGRAALDQSRLPDALEPPQGRVELIGLLQKSRSGGLFATAPVAGVPEMSRLDLSELGQRSSVDLGSMFVLLEQQDPALVLATDSSPGLEVVPRPELDEGPHLGYAFQWFLFTTVVLVGYPLILRRALHEPDDTDDLDTDDADGVHEAVGVPDDPPPTGPNPPEREGPAASVERS